MGMRKGSTRQTFQSLVITEQHEAGCGGRLRPEEKDHGADEEGADDGRRQTV